MNIIMRELYASGRIAVRPAMRHLPNPDQTGPLYFRLLPVFLAVR